MTLNEYQQLALRTAPTNQSSHDDTEHGIYGIIGELGEFVDPVKRERFYKKDKDMVNMIEEVGDIMFYVAILCRACGTTLEHVCQRNIDKLKVRFPDGFTTYDALNRDLTTERAALEGKQL